MLRKITNQNPETFFSLLINLAVYCSNKSNIFRKAASTINSHLTGRKYAKMQSDPSRKAKAT